MSYRNHFTAADKVAAHLVAVHSAASDSDLTRSCIGFLTIAAATAYELAIKEILVNFCERKHKVFGTFSRSQFDRLNGRIKLSDLRGLYISAFGEKYLKRFNAKLTDADNASVVSHGTTVTTCYQNILVWRHSFAHTGVVPATMTFNEALSAYKLGATVVDCVAASMHR